MKWANFALDIPMTEYVITQKNVFKGIGKVSFSHEE